jgi:hypothetical protein
MKTVKINRDELLKKVKENRAKHEEAYNQAQTVFREEAVAKLASMLKTAKAGGEIELYVGLTRPEEHLKDYDQVITMLEMSVDEVIELENSLFAQYVMDKWSWARAFATNTVGYSAKFKG